MDDNNFYLSIWRYILMTICTLVAVLVVGYRFGEAQRVRLISAAKDPVATACALEQSQSNLCVLAAVKTKE